jgi:hypothetical protein
MSWRILRLATIIRHQPLNTLSSNQRGWSYDRCIIIHNIWKLTHTSDKLVVTCFDMYGSSNVSRSLDFVNSIKQSHCFSISEISVALRIITFWHFICIKKNKKIYLKQLVILLKQFHYLNTRSSSQQIIFKKYISFKCKIELLMNDKKSKQFSLINFQRHTKGTVKLSWCSNSVMPSGNWAIWKVKDTMDQY